MNIALWIIQGLVAALFAMIGFNKAFLAADKLKEKMPGIGKTPMPLVRFIGISELLGAIGLIIPLATGIMPILTPIAAAALGLVMILAAIVHIGKKEFKPVGMNVLLLLMCAAVAYFRF